MIRKIDFSDDVLPIYEAEADRLKLSLSQYVNLLLQGYLRPQPGPSPAPVRPVLGPESAPAGAGTVAATHVEESSLKSSSPTEKKEEKEKTNAYCAAPPSEGGELVLFPEVPVVEAAKELARRKREAEREAELAWRIAEVWEDFLFAREAFFRDVSGVKPGSVPELRLVRNDIRQALLIHDRDRLGPEDRERWKRESPVRAAGIGIFYDPWCAGTSPQNDARNGGKRYLEPWRPWKPQRGKPDPVPRFAELYFEVRDQHEAAGR